MSKIKRLNRDVAGFYLKIFFTRGIGFKRIKQYLRAVIIQVRGILKRKGKNTPPVMIVSTTSKCNLNCKGCYAKHTASHKPDMDDKLLKKLFDEAETLGISACIAAGGEPFSRKHLISIMKDHKNILFAVFTNGTLLNGENIISIKKAGNIIPVVSLEGLCKGTDLRRGEGVYSKVEKAMAEMKIKKVFYAASVTIDKDNFYEVTDENFIRTLIDFGVGLIFYIEYVPFQEDTENLELKADEVTVLLQKAEDIMKRFKIPVLVFPGDEEKYGGCLSGGRGFFHVNNTGDIEPCPFSPYSKQNIKNTNIIEALNSDFFKSIREITLKDKSISGCTLFQNKDKVEDLIK